MTLSLALVFSFMTEAHASRGLILSATSAKGQPGDQVVISVTADNAAGSEGGQFLLLFDPEFIQPLTLETGEMITEANNNLHMSNLEYQTGEIIFMWITPEADTVNSGTICDISFNLIRAGKTFINFDEVILVPDEIQLAFLEPGKVIIGDVEAGQDTDNAGTSNEVLIDDSRDDEGEIIGEEALNYDNLSEEDAAYGTGAVRTNTLLYLPLFAAAILALGLYTIFRKRKKGRKKAGR